MPEKNQLKNIIAANAVAKRNSRIAESAQYILREWIAKSVGAPPQFAADNASAAMAAAKTYVEACEAMVFQEPETEPSE